MYYFLIAIEIYVQARIWINKRHDTLASNIDIRLSHHCNFLSYSFPNSWSTEFCFGYYIPLIYSSFIKPFPLTEANKRGQSCVLIPSKLKSFIFSYQMTVFFFLKKTMHFQYLIFLASFGVYFVLCAAEFPYLKQSVKADGSLSFLVVGDWGRKGLYNQSDVAFQVFFSFSARIWTWNLIIFFSYIWVVVLLLL